MNAIHSSFANSAPDALALAALALNNPPSVVRGLRVAWIARWGGQVLLQKRSWHAGAARSFRRVTRGRALFVLMFTAVISLQGVLQPANLSYWSGGQLLRAVAEAFVENSLAAWLLFLGGSTVLEFTAERGITRIVRIVCMSLALPVFALIGCLVGFYITFDDGFFPPVSFIASSALRWAIIGGVLFVIDELIEQQRQHARQLREGATRALRLDRQAAEARLQLMQAQIEPHFLFNTLANVKRLCATDPDGGAALFSHLMVYLRAALPRLRETDSTLATEINLARAYLAVLQIRMGSRLRFSIEVPEVLLSLPFPAMALLTLVENAVKHGLAPAQLGGTITIRAAQHRDRIALTVTDTGVGFGAKGGSGIGIANTRSRLAAVYGDAAELTLAANTPHGVIASIVVPYKPAFVTASVLVAGVSP